MSIQLSLSYDTYTHRSPRREDYIDLLFVCMDSATDDSLRSGLEDTGEVLPTVCAHTIIYRNTVLPCVASPSLPRTLPPSPQQLRNESNAPLAPSIEDSSFHDVLTTTPVLPNQSVRAGKHIKIAHISFISSVIPISPSPSSFIPFSYEIAPVFVLAALIYSTPIFPPLPLGRGDVGGLLSPSSFTDVCLWFTSLSVLKEPSGTHTLIRSLEP